MKVRLKSFEKLKEEGFVYCVYSSGGVCLSNGNGVYKMVDKEWFSDEIEVTDKPKKSVTRQEFEKMKEFFEPQKENLNEIMPEKKEKIPIND
jgi:hypothetical protein